MTIAKLGCRLAMTCTLLVALSYGRSQAQTAGEEELRCPPPLMVCAEDTASSDACPRLPAGLSLRLRSELSDLS